MKQYSSINKQKGNGLLEAIVAVILVGLLSKGTIYLTGRASAVQGDSRVQEIALSQMRSSLSNSANICSTTPQVTLPNNETINVEVQGCNATTTATIKGVVINDVPMPITLSVNSDSLGGQIVVGGTWFD